MYSMYGHIALAGRYHGDQYNFSVRNVLEHVNGKQLSVAGYD